MIDNELENVFEADEVLERMAYFESEIKAAEAERDAFIDRYEMKILSAREICNRKTETARNEMALLTERLKRFAQTQVTDKKRSVQLPSGTLQFRKQQPEFFFDDLKKADGRDERLIRFVKHNADRYLKVKVDESVDWQAFKGTLIIDDDGTVSYSETGEIIDGLHAQILPDKFTVKTK